MTGLVAFTVLVALVGLERVAELVVSTRNARWSRERGGVEHGLGHFPFMVVLHAALLVVRIRVEDAALATLPRAGATTEPRTEAAGA